MVLWKQRSAKYEMQQHPSRFLSAVNTLSPKSSTRLSNSCGRQQVVTSYKSGSLKVTTAVTEDSAVKLHWDSGRRAPE
jgi:hypothetical protein